MRVRTGHTLRRNAARELKASSPGKTVGLSRQQQPYDLDVSARTCPVHRSVLVLVLVIYVCIALHKVFGGPRVSAHGGPVQRRVLVSILLFYIELAPGALVRQGLELMQVWQNSASQW